MALHFLCRQLQLIRLAFGQRLLAQPEQAGFKTGKLEWREGFWGGNRAARDEDLFGEGDADGFAGERAVARRRVPPLDAFDGAALVGWGENQPISYLERTGLDSAGQNAAFIETVNILDRETQRLVLRRLSEVKLI